MVFVFVNVFFGLQLDPQSASWWWAFWHSCSQRQLKTEIYWKFFQLYESSQAKKLIERWTRLWKWEKGISYSCTGRILVTVFAFLVNLTQLQAVPFCSFVSQRNHIWTKQYALQTCHRKQTNYSHLNQKNIKLHFWEGAHHAKGKLRCTLRRKVNSYEVNSVHLSFKHKLSFRLLQHIRKIRLQPSDSPIAFRSHTRLAAFAIVITLLSLPSCYIFSVWIQSVIVLLAYTYTPQDFKEACCPQESAD